MEYPELRSDHQPVRFQDARFQELLITYQNTVLNAQKEVEDNLIAFLRAQEQARFLEQGATAAAEFPQIGGCSISGGDHGFHYRPHRCNRIC